MKYSWINRENNKNFILFMNGWAMDEKAISHLKNNEYDILILNEYSQLDFDLSKTDLSNYKKKYFIAWSMGVYLSDLYSDIINNFDKKIAIAGTQKMIDDEYGIPNKIYNLTIRLFNDESAQKFLKNMFLCSDRTIKIEKTTDEMKDELISIQKYHSDCKIKFDKVIIPKKDIVVPYKNQLNYWEKTSTEIVEIDAPHYVFYNYNSWQELI